MNNEIITQKNWWSKNYKWFVPVVAFLFLSIAVFFNSGMDGIATDLAQSYADTELYNDALEKVKANEKLKKILGELEPIDKLAILEGQVEFKQPQCCKYYR